MKKADAMGKTMTVLKVITYFVALALIVTGVVEGLRMGGGSGNGIYAFMAMFAFFGMLLILGVHILEGIVSVRQQLKRIADAQTNALPLGNIGQMPAATTLAPSRTLTTNDPEKVWYHARQGVGN